MSKNKKAVLLISLGTPDSPSWLNVASYLSQFLGDGRVLSSIAIFFKIPSC